MDNGIPSLLMQAAQSAAQADGVMPPSDGMDNAMQQQMFHQMMQHQQQQNQQPKKSASSPNSSGKKKGPPLRRGKWTPEEEAYANRLIQEFKAGLLPLTDGTTLRTFLSKLLNCDPMRISKKFVGSNCIGKQVFRRRTADLNRLTPEQIQKSRAELSELERRFLERVAQTNRVKTSGVGGASGSPNGGGGGVDGLKNNTLHNSASLLDGSNSAAANGAPWLQGSLGFKQGGASAGGALAGLANGSANSRAAAAGRALLEGFASNRNKPGTAGGSGVGSQNNAGLFAMAELQRRASQHSMLQSMGGNNSAQNFLAAAAGSQGSAMAQMAHNASAARLAELSSGNSLSNLMKGFSRDQLSQLARERGLSSASLSNMIERKNSFDALMGLDFQGLQSIDNLANLIQNGGGSASSAPSSGMKNWSAEQSRSGSNGSLSSAARRLASASNMESLLRSLSGGNVKNGGNANIGFNRDNGDTSNANLQSLLQNMQQSGGMSSLLGGSGNAASLANLLGQGSSAGLSSLNQRNSSIDDFLNMVAGGDMSHQDSSMLNVPLMQQQSNLQVHGGNIDAATMLAQQHLLAQATGNPALANALASRSMGASGSFGNFGSAGGDGNQGSSSSSLSLKRKLLEMGGNTSEQDRSKR